VFFCFTVGGKVYGGQVGFDDAAAAAAAQEKPLYQAGILYLSIFTDFDIFMESHAITREITAKTFKNTLVILCKCLFLINFLIIYFSRVRSIGLI
jgi:hypothetical protein